MLYIYLFKKTLQIESISGIMLNPKAFLMNYIIAVINNSLLTQFIKIAFAFNVIVT